MEAYLRGHKTPLDERWIQDAIKIRTKEYKFISGELIHTPTGERMEDREGNEAWVLKNCPHWRLDYVHEPASDDKIEAELVEQAFGGTNLTARGKLLKKVGPEKFAQYAKLWSVDPYSTKAGTKPSTDDGTSAKKDTAPLSPWSAKTWGSLAEKGEYIKKHGIAAATEAAARYGCTLGSTKPVR